ncbi:unnamed protein product, partial [marine sediment metagenome]
MLRRASGNMYKQGWKNLFTWNPLGGGPCFHDCGYCYSTRMQKQNEVVGNAYSGDFRLSKSIDDNHGENRTIFVSSMTDLFANNVPSNLINDILDKCKSFNNKYLFQSKNPQRFLEFTYPNKTILATTIESDRVYKDTNAPNPNDRVTYCV